MKTIYIVCYGSLKSGFHNNYRLGQNAELVCTMEVRGSMYLHKNYPKLYKPKENTENNVHLCEVWGLDEDCYEEILQMELNEGYIVENINTPAVKNAKIFWMPWEKFDNTDKPITRYDYTALDEETRKYLQTNMHQKPIT